MEPDRQNGKKESKLIGTGEGESPLASVPFQKIEMRTMQSDMSSIAQSGGGNPAPYSPGATPSASSAPQGIAPGSFNVADMSTGGTPPTIPQTPTPPSYPSPSGNGNKHLFMWLMIGLAILIIAAAAYFFLIPFLQNPTGELPAVTETQETTEVTEEEPATTQENLPETLEIHASFFKTPADLTSEVKPESFTAAGVKAAIQPASTTVALFKELVIKTPENKPVTFSTFSKLFFPTFFTSDRTLNFQDDFTFVSYTNKSGTWLGFVAKLKDSSDMAFVQSEMNAFQSEPAIKDFYLTDPGTQLSWKDGKIGSRAASVLEFSTRGQEFAYVWFDRYLIVSSNLEGAAQIAKHLGY